MKKQLTTSEGLTFQFVNGLWRSPRGSELTTWDFLADMQEALDDIRKQIAAISGESGPVSKDYLASWERRQQTTLDAIHILESAESVREFESIRLWHHGY